MLKKRFFKRFASLFMLACLVAITLMQTSAFASGDPITVGATNCDYTDIQSAINAANSGDTIIVASGTYSASQYLILAGKENVSIVGAGVDQTVVKLTSRFDGFKIQANGVSVSNLTLDGALTADYGFRVQAVSGINFNNVKAVNMKKTAFDISRNTNSTYTNITAENNGGYGATITQGTNVNVTGTTRNNSWGGISFNNKLYVGLNIADNALSVNISGVISSEPTKLVIENYNTSDIISKINYNPTYIALKKSGPGTAPVISVHVFRVITVGQVGCNYTNIQSAIDAANPGDTIQIAAGTYRANMHSVPAGKEDIKIVGAGADQTIVQLTDKYDGFNITANGVSVSNLTLDGTNTAEYGFRVQAVKDINFDHVKAINMKKTAFDISRNTNSTYTNIIAENNGGYGVTITQGTNVRVTGTTSNNAWGGINFHNKSYGGGKDIADNDLSVNVTGVISSERTKLVIENYNATNDIISHITYNTAYNAFKSDIQAQNGLVHLFSPYTVTFNSNGGSNVNPVIVGYKKTISQPNNPTLNGYTFAGWHEDSSFNTKWDFVNGVVSVDTTLYAKWDINPYTVTFNSQGGTTVPAVSANYNTLITAPTVPTKMGFTFAGWYKEASFTNAWNFASNQLKSDTTIFAKWNINSYTVTFNSQGGTTVAAVLANYNTLITAPTAPTKTGFTFTGWYKEASDTNAWNFSSEKVKNDTTIFAKWTLSVVIDGKSVELTPANVPTVSLAKTKPSVKFIQATLMKLGFGILVNDGINGPKTKAVIKAFQKSVGLKDDGIYGPATRNALIKKVTGGTVTPAPSPSSINNSSDVQKILNKLGYGPLAVDGKKGPKTTTVIKAFQKAYKLVSDGIVGPKTKAALLAAIN